MNDDELQELLESYEKTVSTGKFAYFDADDMLDIINWYMEEERDADAQHAIQFAKHLHPDNEEITLAEARLLIYQGNYDDASKIISNLDFKDLPDANLLACDVLLHKAATCDDETLRAGIITVAEKGYERTVRQADNDPAFYSSIISQHSREGLFEEGKTWIDRALKLYPDNPAILDASALFLAIHGCGCEAIDLANRLIDNDPYNARSWGIMGDILHDFGDYTQALEAYDYVKALRPDERLSEQNMGDCHFALGHYAEALQLYKSALDNYENGTFAPLPPLEMNFFKGKIDICKMRLKEKKK